MQLIDVIHALFEAEDINTKHHVIDSVLSIIQKLSKKPIDSLKNCHRYINKEDINSIRYQTFLAINSENFDWVSIIERLAYKHIAMTIGPDYLIQCKTNVSIQMPGDETSVLDMHSDCKSGDSPWQMNLWIPLTNAYESNSMYVITMEDSLSYFKKLRLCSQEDINMPHILEELKILQSNFCRTFIKAEKTDILLFNPGVLHGNELNTTDQTRVSLNIRIKSIFTPNVKPKNSDRGIGPYYQKANISKNTEYCEAISVLFE